MLLNVRDISVVHQINKYVDKRPTIEMERVTSDKSVYSTKHYITDGGVNVG